MSNIRNIETDLEFENKIRPQELTSFSGQDKIVDNLTVFIQAAKMRDEALDHVLLHGPPGLGKTTLANIISREMGASLKMTSGPVLDKPGDLAGLLTNLEEGDILFIDEIHRLSPIVEEYPGRRHHAQRTADQSAEGPFRYPVPFGVLRQQCAFRDYPPLGVDSGRADR